MNCHKVKTLLVSCLEGELSGKSKEEVEAHLKTCATCHKEKELLSQSWQMLDSYVTPKLKDDFTASLMRRIHSEQAEVVKVTYRLPQFSFRRLAPVLASLLIVVLTLSLFWRHQPGKERLAKITPSVSTEIATLTTNEEIIRNLDILEDAELLENLNLLSELDVVENLEELTS